MSMVVDAAGVVSSIPSKDLVAIPSQALAKVGGEKSLVEVTTRALAKVGGGNSKVGLIAAGVVAGVAAVGIAAKFFSHHDKADEKASASDFTPATRPVVDLG